MVKVNQSTSRRRMINKKEVTCHLRQISLELLLHFLLVASSTRWIHIEVERIKCCMRPFKEVWQSPSCHQDVL